MVGACGHAVARCRHRGVRRPRAEDSAPGAPRAGRGGGRAALTASGRGRRARAALTASGRGRRARAALTASGGRARAALASSGRRRRGGAALAAGRAARRGRAARPAAGHAPAVVRDRERVGHAARSAGDHRGDGSERAGAGRHRALSHRGLLGNVAGRESVTRRRRSAGGNRDGVERPRPSLPAHQRTVAAAPAGVRATDAFFGAVA